jgi:hypothetical protein
LSAGLACLCAVATASDALAKPRVAHRRHAQVVVVEVPAGRAPLVVPRRSWLDPGTVVPVGSTNRYFVENTFFAYEPIEHNQRSWFMQETLPNRRRLDVVPYEDGLAKFWWP